MCSGDLFYEKDVKAVLRIAYSNQKGFAIPKMNYVLFSNLRVDEA